ncbi:MAG: 50S ribosomal protein L6 [Desulfobacterales bacterium]|nr:50S ribosomal protein L6 [Desulfobacterales bacterium]
MSRVGKKPIPVPNKIKIDYKDGHIRVEGAKGTLSRSIHPDVELNIGDGILNVGVRKDDRPSRALQGLTRSLVSNMIIGVDQGFERVLEINGIGYRAEASGNRLTLNLGYSHPINFELPDGISAVVEKNTIVKIQGIDKEKIGLVAAAIRRLRPPEPYKGKGIKYAEERIQRKAGKTGTK